MKTGEPLIRKGGVCGLSELLKGSQSGRAKMEQTWPIKLSVDGRRLSVQSLVLSLFTRAGCHSAGQFLSVDSAPASDGHMMFTN